MTMKRISDALAIGTISAAINIAAGGGWLSWILINLSLAWLYGRLAPTKA